MTVQLFANNAKTTLASPINATQTTITVAPGTGALFPNPSSGQAFKITLVSASSTTVYEICLCTARSSDILTVVRAQEGTSGTPFLLNDIVGNYDTADVMANLVQVVQLQNQYYLYAVASGTANALAATIPSSFTTIPDGMSIVIKSAAANTGATTLNLTLGSTATGAFPIVTGNNFALIGGEIPGAGFPITMSYSSTFNAWVITDGNVNLSLYAYINSPTFTGTPRVPTAAFNDNSTIIASTAWVQGQLANYAPIYNPTLTGVPAAPTAANGTSTTQIATTAFVQNQISTQIKGLGFGGTIWHDVTASRSANTTYTNSYSYPIMINVNLVTGSSGYTNPSYFYVNGIVVADATSGGWTGGTTFTVSIIVPPGNTYSTNSNSINVWAELY
jgi:hypothetical protein